jgi:hypothetical protein
MSCELLFFSLLLLKKIEACVCIGDMSVNKPKVLIVNVKLILSLCLKRYEIERLLLLRTKPDRGYLES